MEGYFLTEWRKAIDQLPAVADALWNWSSVHCGTLIV